MTYLFLAILAVEGWEGPGSVGKAGERGPYQITQAYWTDAKKQLRKEGYTYELDYKKQVEIAGISSMVMRAYWRRYCKQAVVSLDLEVLARTHNGGPKGARKRSTLKYWKKVKKELERVRQ